jgi:alpha-galactosidase
MRTISRLLSFLFVLQIISAQSRAATQPSPLEQSDARRWASAKFEGKPQPAPDLGYLLPQLKTGSVEKNSRQGHALRIGDRAFEKGIHCPSIGTVKVHLPSPATRFTAVIGVDSNDITYYSSLGRGNVTVTVDVNGKEVYHSPVMHEGMAAIPVSIDLNGAADFTLRVQGTNAAIDWDQVNFADATVTLGNGNALQLADLPIAPLRAEYTSDPPFSFVYGGVKSPELLRKWPLQRTSQPLDAQRTQYTLSYRDPQTGLEVRWVGVEYHDFPTVEWTLYFKNTGAADSPILENILPLDSRIERNGDGEFLLHHNKGAPASPNDYEPYQTPLPKNEDLHLSAKGGRPSNGDFPYLNLSWPGEGVILVIGWPGQWAGQLTRDAANGAQVRLGQELTHFKLLPGEEVRTPRIVMQFWQGEWRRSQNIWRRWMQAHNMPHPGGQLPPPQMAANTSREYVEMTEATDRDENMFIDRYVEEKLHPDYFWMDAGWYPNNGSWVNVGTWEVDPKRFPQGLKAVSDHAHANGIKIILWFEPERVTKESWLYEHHPEWLLTPPPKPGDQLYDPAWRLFNFGNPDACQWMTDHVDQIINQQGIDLYRQDFNMDPLNYWRANDQPDRQGITEIRYVTGYLAYWDELRRRHPNMLLDSCASGGRRNDIDTLRRAVPLTRSDYLLEPVEPISQQMQTLGMAQWIPYFGTGTSGVDPYVFRSQMTPAIITSWDLRRKDSDTDAMRKLVQQWRAISPNYYGDFYPLTSYSLSNDVWAAMQFDRPEAGEGFVEVFRRSQSACETASFKLQGLDPAARYTVNNLDTSGSQEFSGQELMNRGLEVRLDHAPQSALFSYRRVGASSQSTAN